MLWWYMYNLRYIIAGHHSPNNPKRHHQGTATYCRRHPKLPNSIIATYPQPKNTTTPYKLIVPTETPYL